MPLWAQHLVVADPAAVLFQHPDAILLRRVNALNTPACQSFQIEVGKRLVRTVILRAHETVELAVIHRREPFLELRRLFFQPFREPVADFVNLGVGELYALAVTHLDVVAVLIFANTFHHVGSPRPLRRVSPRKRPSRSRLSSRRLVLKLSLSSIAA